MVRLVPYGVRECKQAGSNRWIRERQTETSQTNKKRKEGRKNRNRAEYVLAQTQFLRALAVCVPLGPDAWVVPVR
jgi:hypothetical protein